MSRQQVVLAPGSHAVIGYGSLWSVTSLERTLGHPYRGPFASCRLEGWRRSWNVAMPNDHYFMRVGGERIVPREILYLNIRPDAQTSVNGVLFVVSETELAELDARESVYDRVRVNDALREIDLRGGDAWAYVAKPAFVRTNVRSWRDAAIRASYLRIVESGLGTFGADACAAFDRSTDPAPAALVIDDEDTDPRR